MRDNIEKLWLEVACVFDSLFYQDGHRSMSGKSTISQEALFYSFNVERHVPAGHLLRSNDRFVDLSGICEHLQSDTSSR
ncbi:hypothetical protein [Novosphingobium sp. PhB57]|uniref:hypothetical protein n=1 Tax=Novosphingobium sp. PhB57 TaxID=2485107 RepID=UPI001A9FEA76|nr:hypothetical protein [Novosphingobium sp. PhB57]